MQLEIIHSKFFPVEYRELAKTLEVSSVFYSANCFDNLAKTVVTPGDRACWFGVKQPSGMPALLMPLWEQARGFGKPIKITALANYYTSLYEPLHNITDITELEKAIELITGAISKMRWDVINLYLLDLTSKCYTLLIKSFRQHSKYVTPYFMYGNWFLVTQGQSFADY